MDDKKAETVAVSGKLFESSFPSPDLDVAEILDVRDGRLRWRPRIVAARSEREIQGVRGLLYSFIELADASDDAIENFARRWGPLGLCKKHRAALCHTATVRLTPADGGSPCAPLMAVAVPESIPDLRQMPDLFFAPICPPRVEKGSDGEYQRGVYSEPTERWRFYSRKAGALIRVANRIRRGESADGADWKLLIGQEPSPGDLEHALVLLAGAFNMWQWLADLRPTVAVNPTSGAMQLWLVSYSGNAMVDLQGRIGHARGYAGGLFAALATHLLLQTTGGAGLAVCDACATWYWPTRVPPQGQKHYCVPCRNRNARQRQWKREHS